MIRRMYANDSSGSLEGTLARLLITATIVAISAFLGVAAAGGETTFTRDVVPILQAHCQECHRAGGAAPFELSVYDHVYRRRDKIAATVRARAMPPWKPVAGYGDFVGARGLSKDEVATILRWVEGGAPEGDPRDRPPVKIGGYLGGWTPGSRPWVMPEGVGIRLPPGARVVVQMHYHNARLSPETDQTELRLYPATAPVAKSLQFMRVGQFSLTIPAGAARHEIDGTAFVYRPMSLIAIHPHMHLLGREMKVWARLADESKRPLIHIDDWDFHWQGFYFYKSPVALPVGSFIEMMATWDNSADNPRNPNTPPRRVYWGERTVDEMGHAAVLFTFDDETRSR